MRADIHPKIIESLGLSEKESRVFAVLIEYALPQSVQSITRKSGLPRMTVFGILHRLEKQNLVRQAQVPFRKKKWWKYKKGLEFVDKHKAITLPIIGKVE